MSDLSPLEKRVPLVNQNLENFPNPNKHSLHFVLNLWIFQFRLIVLQKIHFTTFQVLLGLRYFEQILLLFESPQIYF